MRQWQEVVSRRSETKSEESQSSVTVERGDQLQFESEEDCGGEGQMGESQGHHGLWSRRSTEEVCGIKWC